MRTDPVSIEGIAGPVVVRTTGLSASIVVEVDGEPVERSGDDHYLLPGADGHPHPAVLRMKFWQIFPTLLVDNREVRTGQKTPVWLIVLAALPVIMIIAPIGWTGIPAGVLTLLTNQSALRETRNPVLRVARVLFQNVIGFFCWLVLREIFNEGT